MTKITVSKEFKIGQIACFKIKKAVITEGDETPQAAAPKTGTDGFEIVTKGPHEVLKDDELLGVEIASPGAYPPQFSVEFTSVIGRGCFGVVYEAKSKRHGKCAIKVSFGRSSRLEQEIRAHAQVSRGIEKELKVEKEGSRLNASSNSLEQKKASGFRHIPKYYFGALFEASSAEDFAAADSVQARGSKNAFADNVQQKPQDAQQPENHPTGLPPGSDNDALGISVLGMELCLPITLHEFILKRCFTIRADFLTCARQVLEAVAAVHRYKVLHRDIKLQNFVFDAQCRIRLLDFGLASCEVGEEGSADVVAGTPQFMAPEMAANVIRPKEKRKPVGLPADVWSTGIVLFAMLTRRSPYPKPKPTGGGDEGDKKMTTMELVRRVAQGIGTHWPTFDELESELKVVREQGNLGAVADKQAEIGLIKTPLVRRLVNELVKKEPSKRPTLHEVLENKLLWSVGADSKSMITISAPVPEVVKGFVPLPAEPLPEPYHSSATSIGHSSLQDSPPSPRSSGERRTHGPTDTTTDIKPESTEEEADFVPPMITKPTSSIAEPPEFSSEVKPFMLQPAMEQKEVELITSTTTTAGGFLRPEPLRKAAPPKRSATRSSSKARVSWAGKEDLHVIVKGEREHRVKLQRLLQLELKALHSYIRIEEQQDVAWYTLTWTAENEQKYASHDHRFQLVTRIPKNYDNGVSCDMCPEVTESDAKKVQFYHCSCGMDLCVKCEELWRARRTCGCGKVLGSLTKLEEHKNSRSCHRKKSPPVGKKAAEPNVEQPPPVTKKVKIGEIKEEKITSASTLPTKGKKEGKSTEGPNSGRISARSKRSRVSIEEEVAEAENEAEKKPTRGSGRGAKKDQVDPKVNTRGKKVTPASATSAPTLNSLQGGVVPPSMFKPTAPPPEKDEWDEEEEDAQPILTVSAAGKSVLQRLHQPDQELDLLGTGGGTGNVGTRYLSSGALQRTPAGAPQQPIRPPGPISRSRSYAGTYETPAPVTQQESEMLFEGPWVQYFHYAYPPQEARDTRGGGNPLAFCYEIQQGRMGAMFVANGVSDLHSCVFSSFPSEFLFIVEDLDWEEARDSRMLVQGHEARAHYPTEVSILQRIQSENINLLKTNRAPGTMSMCPRRPRQGTNPLAQFGTALNEEVIYVRWVRSHEEAGVIMFALSNGGIQVFGPGYELRWFNEERKFLVRPNGVCAVINDASFEGMQIIEDLLHEPLFPDDGFLEQEDVEQQDQPAAGWIQQGATSHQQGELPQQQHLDQELLPMKDGQDESSRSQSVSSFPGRSQGGKKATGSRKSAPKRNQGNPSSGQQVAVKKTSQSDVTRLSASRKKPATDALDGKPRSSGRKRR